MTAGFLSREIGPCASVLSVTGYVKFRGATQNETKKGSLENMQSKVTILIGVEECKRSKI